MASFFDQAPLYDNSRSTGSIRDLLLMQGEQKAQAARQAGDNWARTIGGIGNAVAGGVAAYGEHKAEQKQQEQMRMRDAATADAISRFDPANPKDFLGRMVAIRGPKEGTQMAETILKFSQNGKDENPESHLKSTHAALGMFLKESPELQAASWPQFKAGLQPTIAKLGLPVQLPDEYSPEIAQMLTPAHQAIGETIGYKPEKVDAPKPVEVNQGATLVDPVTGKVIFAAPEKAMKAEHVDLGDSVGILDAQGNVVRKIPKGVSPGSVGQGAGGDTAEEIAQAIIRGEQPPDMKALYKYGAPVRAILAKNGYKMAEAQADWQATQRHVATMNGPKFQGMVTAIDTASEALDQIDMLAKQWDAGGFKDLNRAQLGAAKKGLLGPEAAKIATALEAQITDVTSELGQVYQGGNSPTDHALQLAGKNLSADWSKDVLLSMTDLARKNIQIRKNSIRNSRPMGTGDNPYSPQATPAATAPSAPAGLPRAGSKAEYDAIPAGAMYVGSDGQVRKKGS